MKNKNNYLLEILNNRNNVIRFIFITILLSFGLSVIAGSLTFTNGFKAVYGFSVGGVIILLVIAYLFWFVLKSMKKELIIDCILIHDKKENKLIDIGRYSFSKGINDYLFAALSEDKDLKAIWDREPLGCYQTVGDWMHGRISKSRNIINEVVEYYVIEELSLHLSRYFNNSSFSKENIQEIARNEVPEVLYQNRFLNLFSKPMEERASFDNPKRKEEEKPKEYYVNGKKITLEIGETVYAFGKDGARYNKFNLVLPKSSRVKRVDKNTIRIITDRFNFDIYVNFEEEPYSPPEGFIEHYLCPGAERTDRFFRYEGYEMKVELRIQFKILKFLFNGKWEYFYWLDSFLERINQRMSSSEYFERINWESTYTMLEVIEKNKSRE
ncbi:hypothetical protein ABH897_004695 [Paenibacillus sp. RC73]|uniref:hypothetical protein n=1 Tax=Paenibacillus sp. RC73 TaxID=3156250 RepID=UPI003833002C